MKRAIVATVLIIGTRAVCSARAMTWAQREEAGRRDWSSIATSSDGTFIAAVDSGKSPEGGSIWTSSNGGITWTDQKAAGARHWTAIASSADGRRLAAVDQGERDKDGPAGGDIWTSTNGGVTWTDQKAAGARHWTAIASSADGRRLAAVDQGERDKAGASVEEKDNYGNTPLMLAAAWNANVDVLKALLEAGGGVNDSNNDGDTPLIWAAARNANVDVISTLIKAGANLSARTKDGDSALDVTRYNDSIRGTDALRQFRKLLGAKDQGSDDSDE